MSWSAHVIIMTLHVYNYIQDENTALYVASLNGHCGVVRMLLKAKADVNMKTNVSHAGCYYTCSRCFLSEITKNK